jgi:hypothetical protein
VLVSIAVGVVAGNVLVAITRRAGGHRRVVGVAVLSTDRIVRRRHRYSSSSPLAAAGVSSASGTAVLVMSVNGTGVFVVSGTSRVRAGGTAVLVIVAVGGTGVLPCRGRRHRRDSSVALAAPA